jgi:hypothetical protein
LAGCVVSTGVAEASRPALVLVPGKVVEASTPSTGTLSAAPADGRLRGQDFTAVVSRVAWPAFVTAPSGVAYVASSDRRLVAFTLSVTQPTDDSGLLNAPTAAAGALKIGSEAITVSMTRINQQIAGGTSGSSETTGTDSFVASVPARAHDVALALTEAGFTQSLNLWTLERIPPSPVVLYRDPKTSTVTGTTGSPFHLAFTNPADGFTSSDDAQVSSATLTWFAPNSTFKTPPKTANEAFLVLGLQSSYPDIPYGQPDSGHFFSSFNPMAGAQLTFTPIGGPPADGIATTAAFSSTNAASDDDGLFDAVYFFTVPATTTGGTLTVNTGQEVGDEYTGFTGTGNSTVINLTASATTTLRFPDVPSAPPPQKKPPWVDATLPATGLAAAGSGSTSAKSSPGRGFPIWPAVLLLVLVAAAVVVAQRVRGRHAPAPAEATAGTSAVEYVTTDPPVTVATQVVAEPGVATAPVSTDSGPEALDTELSESDGSMAINVMGWRHFVGFPAKGGSPSLEALGAYLVWHDAHHLSADQIALGMWPFGRAGGDVARKTVHNNLSGLRGWIGVEHLPDAAVAGGYLIEGIESDWRTFQRLSREADTVGGASARALRSEALELVRGRPFEGLSGPGYDWVEAEGLVDIMTNAIITCATRLGADLIEAGDFTGAQDAATAGLRAARDEYGLWELGARAIWARGDRSALERWLAEAARQLGPAAVERIRSSFGHDEPSES